MRIIRLYKFVIMDMILMTEICGKDKFYYKMMDGLKE